MCETLNETKNIKTKQQKKGKYIYEVFPKEQNG